MTNKKGNDNNGNRRFHRLRSGQALESGGFEVYVLPFAALYACSDLAGGFAFLGLLVGVDGLFHAGGAGCSVGSFKAAVQAVVSEGAIAVAVAGLLMENRWNLSGHFVHDYLVGMREIDAR